MTASFAMVLEGGRAAPGEASLRGRAAIFKAFKKKDRSKKVLANSENFATKGESTLTNPKEAPYVISAQQI